MSEKKSISSKLFANTTPHRPPPPDNLRLWQQKKVVSKSIKAVKYDVWSGIHSAHKGKKSQAPPDLPGKPDPKYLPWRTPPEKLRSSFVSAVVSEFVLTVNRLYSLTLSREKPKSRIDAIKQPNPSLFISLYTWDVLHSFNSSRRRRRRTLYPTSFWSSRGEGVLNRLEWWRLLLLERLSSFPFESLWTGGCKDEGHRRRRRKPVRCLIGLAILYPDWDAWGRKSIERLCHIVSSAKGGRMWTGSRWFYQRFLAKTVDTSAEFLYLGISGENISNFKFFLENISNHNTTWHFPSWCQ